MRVVRVPRVIKRMMPRIPGVVPGVLVTATRRQQRPQIKTGGFDYRESVRVVADRAGDNFRQRTGHRDCASGGVDDRIEKTGYARQKAASALIDRLRAAVAIEWALYNFYPSLGLAIFYLGDGSAPAHIRPQRPLIGTRLRNAELARRRLAHRARNLTSAAH